MQSSPASLRSACTEFVFHPFFVAPFLLWKLREGQWKLALLYGVSYAVIVLWWVCYPGLISPLVAQSVGHASKGNFVTDQLIPALLRRDPRTMPLMVLNLMRLIAWQNLALVPLLIAAAPVAARQRGLARALFIGIIMWTLFVTFILPSQGRGWGYRYLNGYIGSFALLAGFGYRELEQRIGRQADGLVLFLSGLTAVAAIPLLLATTDGFMQPRLKAERLVEIQPTPFVLIDNELSDSTDGHFRGTTDDLVRNLPDLSNRPLRFASDRLDAELLIGLCRRGPVTLITHRDMHAVGKMLNVSERSPNFEGLVRAAQQKAPGCFRNAVFRGANNVRKPRLMKAARIVLPLVFALVLVGGLLAWSRVSSPTWQRPCAVSPRLLRRESSHPQLFSSFSAR